MIGWLSAEDPTDSIVPPVPGFAWPLRIATAILTFLAVMLLALGLTGNRLATELGEPQVQSATLQIITDASSIEDEARAALDVLRRTQGILSVRVLEIDEQRRLLEPWLGTGAAVEDLPLPLMIDVTTDPTLLDVALLEAELAAEAPDAIFDDHGTLRSELSRAARGLQVFAFGTAGALGLGFVALFLLAARATILGSRGAIRTLRLIGARDGFVAGIVSRRMTRVIFFSALVGCIIGLIVLRLLPDQSPSGFYLVAIMPHGVDWIFPCLVPVLAALLGWLVTRRTVRRMIRQWS